MVSVSIFGYILPVSIFAYILPVSIFAFILSVSIFAYVCVFGKLTRLFQLHDDLVGTEES